MKRAFYSKLEHLAIVRKEKRDKRVVISDLVRMRCSLSQNTFSLSEHFGNAFSSSNPQPAGCGAVVRGCYPAGPLALESRKRQDGVAGRIQQEGQKRGKSQPRASVSASWQLTILMAVQKRRTKCHA